MRVIERAKYAGIGWVLKSVGRFDAFLCMPHPVAAEAPPTGRSGAGGWLRILCCTGLAYGLVRRGRSEIAELAAADTLVIRQLGANGQFGDIEMMCRILLAFHGVVACQHFIHRRNRAEQFRRKGAPAQNAFRFAILSAATPGLYWLAGRRRRSGRWRGSGADAGVGISPVASLERCNGCT